ncbi:MAG: DNA mismatch repair protein MutS [Burkholderiaceae bacterium]|nr:DNA mismatch repair protein MutS [Burkholderiaceae bacterium]
MTSDKELFLAAVADAKRLPPAAHPPSVIAKPKPRPIPIKRLEDEADALMASRLSDMTPESLLDSDESLSFARHGISSDTLRRLRRGHWVVQAGLDLHGMRTDEAREAFVGFLRHCSHRDIRCVRIIHGKGLGSANRQPVLKGKVLAWLQQRDEVLAYCQAPANDGGSGAVRVLLRHAKNT